MGHIIVKAARDRDLYLIWSSIVDNAVWVGDRSELLAELWAEHHQRHPGTMPVGSNTPEARVERADRNGSSDLSCRDAWWEDETLMVGEGSPDDGWYHVRRDRLADYAEALLRDDEAAAVALLECWKRNDEDDD